MPDAEPDDKVRRLACLRYAIFYAGSYFDSGRPVPHVLEDLVESHSLVSLPRIHGTEAANAWGRWYDIVDRAKQPVAVVEWASVSERLVMSGSALALLPVYTPCLHPSLRELPLDDEPHPSRPVEGDPARSGAARRRVRHLRQAHPGVRRGGLGKDAGRRRLSAPW